MNTRMLFLLLLLFISPIAPPTLTLHLPRPPTCESAPASASSSMPPICLMSSMQMMEKKQQQEAAARAKVLLPFLLPLLLLALPQLPPAIFILLDLISAVPSSSLDTLITGVDRRRSNEERRRNVLPRF
eukprot:758730-Hanusia_phi.AAC.1